MSSQLFLTWCPHDRDMVGRHSSGRDDQATSRKGTIRETRVRRRLGNPGEWAGQQSVSGVRLPARQGQGTASRQGQNSRILVSGPVSSENKARARGRKHLALEAEVRGHIPGLPPAIGVP